MRNPSTVPRDVAEYTVRTPTTAVLIVAEALHDSAPKDVHTLTSALAEDLSEIWDGPVRRAILSESSPRLDI